MVLAALGIGAVGLYLMRDLVAPAFFALTLVITVRPLVSWATGRGVPRPVAAVLAVILVFGFLLSFFVALGVAVAQLVDTLPEYSDEFQAIWRQVQAQLANMGIDQASLLDQATNAVDTSRIVAMAQALLGQLSSAGAMLGVMALTVVFLMFDTAKIETRAAALNLLKPEMATALAGFASSVRSYWLVSTIFGLIVAVLDVVALWILGVPLAITWGVLSFITNYIPNVGFFIGVIPPALLALVDSGPWTALWVLLAYMVLNFVIQSLIQPKFTGDAVGLNTTATFLSLLLWSSIVGGLGTILAVPLTLFAKALIIDSDPRSRWVGIFLSAGDTPVRDPDELDPEVLDELDLDGDGTGAADPEHGVPVVEEESPATPAP
ncbi:AI-2E family transporter [Actinomyces bowdenii]|nr:AI-2E family transporter [Actinomyces bowdenii]MCR2053680.1 AI-2E family transporter [Actinomyces bowdenii]